MERQHLLTRLDLRNIERASGLRVAEKHREDMVSVATWVAEQELMGQNADDDDNESMQSPFFCYNPLTTENGTFTLGNEMTITNTIKFK